MCFSCAAKTEEDWTYPDPSSAEIARQRAHTGSTFSRLDEATLLSKSTDLMTGTFLGSNANALTHSNLSSREMGTTNKANASLVNRSSNVPIHHSDGSTAGLGGIAMMTDERRVYRIFQMTGVSRFTTETFKLVDLPTRIDMRDVVVSVIRPRDVSQTTDPVQDYLGSSDVIVFGQLADFSNLIRTDNAGDAVPLPTPEDTGAF